MRRGLALSVSLAFAALPILVAGCPSYTNIPEVARAEIDATQQGELLWLKQSLYVGQFYDDDRYELVYPRRFDQLNYLRTIEGDPIPPPPARGIIPAGTRVRVDRIEWPTGDRVFARPIYTPRYTTWVFLRVGAERGKTNLERPKRHILIMPGGIPDAETFRHWYSAYLVEEDPNPWLEAMPPALRQGVLEKQPALGMDYAMLTSAMGYPDKMTRAPEEGGSTMEVAIYGAASVVLRDGVVIKISDPAQGIDLSADSPGVAPTPSESAPSESAPSESAPSESAPAEGTAAESGPAESAPAESGPAESGPAESGPAESGPAESGPAEPAAAEPAAAPENTAPAGTDSP